MNHLNSAAFFLAKGIQQGIQTVTPAVVDEIFNQTLQDTRIGKMARGIFLSLMGLGLIAKGGILQNLKGKVAHLIHPGPTLERSEPKIHWGIAALGLLVAAYGFYHLVSGLLDFKENKPTPTFNPEEQCENVTDFDVSSHEHQSLWETQKRLKSCSVTKKLWNNLEKNGGITLFSAKAEEAHFGAFIDPEKGEIYLAKGPLNRMTKDLLFELNNLKQRQFLNFIEANPCFLSAEKYAMSKEKIEFESAKATYQMTKKCLELGVWPKDSYLYNGFNSGLWSTFEGFLKTQKESGHFAEYLKDWHDACPN